MNRRLGALLVAGTVALGATPAAAQVLFYEDFETDLSQWTTPGCAVISTAHANQGSASHTFTCLGSGGSTWTDFVAVTVELRRASPPGEPSVFCSCQKPVDLGMPCKHANKVFQALRISHHELAPRYRVEDARWYDPVWHTATWCDQYETPYPPLEVPKPRARNMHVTRADACLPCADYDAAAKCSGDGAPASNQISGEAEETTNAGGGGGRRARRQEDHALWQVRRCRTQQGDMPELRHDLRNGAGVCVCVCVFVFVLLFAESRTLTGSAARKAGSCYGHCLRGTAALASSGAAPGGCLGECPVERASERGARAHQFARVIIRRSGT